VFFRDVQHAIKFAAIFLFPLTATVFVYYDKVNYIADKNLFLEKN